jgi:multidrug efflux system outer membrane protein
MNRLALQAIAALASAALLAGCMTAPEYKRPDAAPPAAYRFAGAEPASAQSIADLPWWSVFNDPPLQDLIGQGLVNNTDLKLAAARIEEARALVGVVHSQMSPQVGYQASIGGERAFVATPKSAGAVDVGLLGGGLNLAWEFDVWGRIRKSTEAAQHNLLQQEDIRRGVMLTLVTDIATGYFNLLALDRELQIAQDSQGVYKQSVSFFNQRFEAGRDSRLPVDRSQANYEQSGARIAEVKQLIAVQEDALSVLIGGYPNAIPRGRGLTGQALPQAPLGATTALLQRRPDILAAEQGMMSANAQIGVAVADYFPRIGLSALVGGVETYLDGNWAGFGVWNAALGAAGPIFTGGRLEQQYKNRQAYWDETVAGYKKTVLVAFQETADALAAQQNLVQQRASLENQVAALQRSADTARSRFDEGRASYFEILEAQQQLFPAEDRLALTQRDQLVAVVGLYKALGGGWSLEPGQWTQPPHASPTAAAAGSGGAR